MESNRGRFLCLHRRYKPVHMEGAGVCLHIVKKIVENRCGKIKVESEVGKGSSFKVYLKCK